MVPSSVSHWPTRAVVGKGAMSASASTATTATTVLPSALVTRPTPQRRAPSVFQGEPGADATGDVFFVEAVPAIDQARGHTCGSPDARR